MNGNDNVIISDVKMSKIFRGITIKNKSHNHLAVKEFFIVVAVINPSYLRMIFTIPIIIRINPIIYDGQKIYEYKISQSTIFHDSMVILYIPAKIGIINGSNPVKIIYFEVVSFFFICFSLLNVSRETFIIFLYVNYTI